MKINQLQGKASVPHDPVFMDTRPGSQSCPEPASLLLPWGRGPRLGREAPRPGSRALCTPRSAPLPLSVPPEPKVSLRKG